MTKMSEDIKLDFDDVLIRPKRSVVASRSLVEVNRTFQFYHSSVVWHGFPLFISNMYNTGTMKMSESLMEFKTPVALHKFYSPEEILKFFIKHGTSIMYTWVSIGQSDFDIERLKIIKEIFQANCHVMPNIVLDVANGYSEKFVKTCAHVREIIGDSILMAGNVCTPEMVEELIIHGGVDIVKIGIGPGSKCKTREVTGVGVPQLSAIIECSDAAHGLKSADKRNGLICADGGLRTSGDVCKAFGANADFLMSGGMFMGTKECEGTWKNNKLICYGMSSSLAQEIHNNGVPKYAASEGSVELVEFKGPAADIVTEIAGGLRSCCSYINCSSLKDMAKCTTFVRKYS